MRGVADQGDPMNPLHTLNTLNKRLLAAALLASATGTAFAADYGASTNTTSSTSGTAVEADVKTPVGAVSAGAALSTGKAKEDAKFFEKAALTGMYEVKAGELGQKNGTDPQIRAFGEMMVKDHGTANDKLKALALSKGISLPTALDEKHQKMLDKLAKEQPGKKFDEEFADQMEKSHDAAVKLFEKTSKDAKDPEVKAFAVATLPALKTHDEMAEKLDKKDIAP
jgi:putative membrane protein